MSIKITVCDRDYAYSGHDTSAAGALLHSFAGSQNVHWQNSVVGGTLVKYKDIIKHGGDATTTLNGFTRKLSVKPVTVRWTQTVGGFTSVRTGYWSMKSSPYIPNAPAFPDALVQQARSQAESAFIKQIKGARTKWAAGEPLGDIAQAAHLLVKPLQSLEALTINAGRGVAKIASKLRNASQASMRLQAATDSYLAYTFGAQPLIKDIKAAAKEIDHITNGVAPHGVIRLIATGTSKSGWFGAQRADFNLDDGYASPAVREDVSILETCTVRIIGGYRGESRSADLAFFDSAGLAPSDWVPTLYQLFPWSFVLDYFVNAGSALDGLCLGSVDFAWLQETVRYTRTVDSRGIYPVKGSEAKFGACYGGQIRDVQTSVSRAHRSNTFDPGLRFHLPSSGQALSLVALANTLESLKNPKR